MFLEALKLCEESHELGPRVVHERARQLHIVHTFT